MTPALDPAAVVQRQLEAYNARDTETLVAIYADDAEHFEFPSKRVAHGSAQIRERFQLRFQEPNLHARLNHRTVIGHRVIDHETITRTFPEGPGHLDLLAIYEVVDGRIARAWFLAGPPTLDPAPAA